MAHFKKIFALTASVALAGFGYQHVMEKDQHVNLFAGNANVSDNIALSEKLTYMGYDTGSCHANGRYDVALETAVKNFQITQGQKPTGVLDQETNTALTDYFDDFRSLREDFNETGFEDYQQQSAKMRQQQLALMALGYDLSPCYASGTYDDQTRKAVTKFQQDHDIKPYSQNLDAATRNAIWQEIDQLGQGYNGADLMVAYAGNVVTDNPLSQKLFYDMRLATLENTATQLKERLPDFVVDAMADASLQTGWDLSYLGKLVKTESAGKAWAEAQDNCPKEQVCSATGLYQFTNATWVSAFKKYGGQYGYDDLIARAKSDDKAKQYMMDLRKDPKVASLILIDWTKENYQALVKNFGTRIGKTEAYMAHFLGVGGKDKGAIKFMNAYYSEPKANAAEMFPSAAKSNPNIFYQKSGKGDARTVAEVYQVFAKKMAPKGDNQLNIASAMPQKNTALRAKQLSR